jgi:AcrR family transcriptional regulator
MVDDKMGSYRPPGPAATQAGKAIRVDAQRNLETLLAAAKAVFAEKGVDAPVRDIAARAGVGVGTFYRHFPERSDLIAAVFRQEVDACAEAADALASEQPPEQALSLWIARYLDFIATKRGLAKSLHSGNPAFSALPSYFETRLTPACATLLAAAAAAGKVRADIEPWDLLRAVALLAAPDHEGKPDHSGQMVALLLDGLRYGAAPSA